MEVALDFRAAEYSTVRLVSGVPGLSTQAYYAPLKQAIGDRQVSDAYVIDTPSDAHGDDRAFGYRSLADVLERLGFEVGERRVWRLWSTTVAKGRCGKRPGPPVHDDHIQRDFSASHPNLK